MSLVAELHNAHKARVAAIAAKAAEHEASKKTALIAELRQCCEPKPEPKPAPEPVEDGWVERRVTKDHLWFQIVKDKEVLDEGRTLSIAEIKRAICQHFDLQGHDLLSKRRHARIVIPRQIAMYLCKQLTTRSLPEIGRMFGGMDHTTVLHAIRATEKRMRENWTLAIDIAHIEELLA